MIITLSPDLERLVAEQVESGRYKTADEVIRDGLALLKSKSNGAPVPPPGNSPEGRPVTLALVEAIAEISKGVPDSDWATLPTDLAKNFRHYSYGHPKEP